MWLWGDHTQPITLGITWESSDVIYEPHLRRGKDFRRLVRKGGVGSDGREPGCAQRPRAGASGAHLRHLGGGGRGASHGAKGWERPDMSGSLSTGCMGSGQRGEWQLAGAAQGEGPPRQGPARSSGRCSHPGKVPVTEGARTFDLCLLTASSPGVTPRGLPCSQCRLRETDSELLLPLLRLLQSVAGSTRAPRRTLD